MTKCMALGLVLAAGSASLGQVLYSNGPLSTGANTQSGVAAPAGATWSEVSNDAGVLTIANTTAGFGAGGTVPGGALVNSMTDDFTVPAGQTWNVTGFKFYSYQTGAVANPFTEVRVKIWDRDPTVAGAVTVFGDLTTNRLATTGPANIYRTFNTVVPPICNGTTTPAATNRQIFELNATAVVSLPPGTYWVEWGAVGSPSFSGPWCPLTTLLGTRQADPNANAYEGVPSPAYALANDAGQPAAACPTLPPPIRQAAPFQVIGAVASTCYPDCNGDGILNLADFGCFQTKFALGDAYADCNGDGVRNLSDFGCFQTKFALGCP